MDNLQNQKDAYDLLMKGYKTARLTQYVIYGSLYRPIDMIERILDYLDQRIQEETPEAA